MTYFIDEQTGSVYWKGIEESDRKITHEDIIFYAPMLINNSFDTEESAVVDAWESKETEERIKALLNGKN